MFEFALPMTLEEQAIVLLYEDILALLGPTFEKREKLVECISYCVNRLAESVRDEGKENV